MKEVQDRASQDAGGKGEDKEPTNFREPDEE